MRFASHALSCFLLASCTDPYKVTAAAPEKQLPESAAQAVVRVDVDGSIAGSGVVVTPEGCIITSSSIVTRYRTGTITVGEGRIRASIVAVDAPHRLALLKAETPLPVWATLGPARGPVRDASLRIVGYAALQSDPPMVERRTCTARVDDPHYRGDSADDLDLHDLLLADMGCSADEFKFGGSGVFTLDDGRLAGVVIGKMRAYGSSPLVAMPASTVRGLLESRLIDVPSGD